ncbi:Complex1-LYR-dom domain-containing protein [Fusarium keratoplasticum]|uniref:Complex1-LYR-dom domain-containing protein n=1 Tax=Fusarium keratoplasticum TaxID=1328300 RepID=A0ACC0RBT5_9HYPO|nr:Complex1-LYR-dom domain-containing protein [Fusarium keratoplasticum]KAI8680253.1 Complex1-LYR-dom domain-containing protein [Fusarium keratoplasticum]KAI8686323.1 Complex1-LYR-dom domain-containing protein [Fusarium keratoplasticum]
MFRQPFVPARNSRHRIAALALYRALIKTGKKVPLPKDLQHPGPTHPIAHIVRKRFVKNKPLASLRLVYNSMASGYKFLTLLTRGQTTDNFEHAQITQFLRQRNEASALSRSRAPPPSTRRQNPPLLTKVSPPDAPPEYKPTVRPLPKTAFVGERKVPTVANTSGGQVFLRIKKPQPRVLSRAVGRRSNLFRKDLLALLDIEEENLGSADEEDRWESLMNKQLAAEGFQDKAISDGTLGSYRWSEQLSKSWIESQLDRRWSDWVARGKAVNELVQQEKALAKAEERIPRPSPDDTEAATAARETLDKILEEARQKEAARNEETETKPFQDPFMAPLWVERVQELEKQQMFQGQFGGKPRKGGKKPDENFASKFPLDAFAAIKASRR